ARVFQEDISTLSHLLYESLLWYLPANYSEIEDNRHLFRCLSSSIKMPATATPSHPQLLLICGTAHCYVDTSFELQELCVCDDCILTSEECHLSRRSPTIFS